MYLIKTRTYVCMCLQIRKNLIQVKQKKKSCSEQKLIEPSKSVNIIAYTYVCI